jgi:hypothetical protein
VARNNFPDPDKNLADAETFDISAMRRVSTVKTPKSFAACRRWDAAGRG